MEIFNEMITMQVLYLMMCFSDFVLDPEIRSFCGLAFIAVVCLYASVHIFFLLSNVYAQIRHLIRKKYYARRNKKILSRLRETKMTGHILMNSSTAKVKISAKEKGYGQDVRNELEKIAEVSDHRLEISHDY